MAACFSHFTSTPIFVHCGKVYIGKYAKVSIFAWGKGGSNKNNGGSVRRSEQLRNKRQ